MRVIGFTLLVLLLFIAALLFMPRQPVDPRPRVSGDECPTVHTDGPMLPTEVACWNKFAAVGVFICPTQAHPDWLTALPPYCPP